MTLSDAEKRSTLRDVAAIAKVGEATVDRVLNGRGGVRPETAQAVLEAARGLNLKRILPPSHHAGLRIEVLLNRRELPLIARMSEAFEEIAHGLDRSIIMQRTVLPDDKPSSIATRLRATTSNAVIVYAPEDDVVIQAVDALVDAGVAVVTVISDLPRSGRLAYAGTDHYQAGRTAGYFLSGMVRRRGPVLVLCHNLRVQSHADRIRGLRAHFADTPGGLHVTEVVEGGDNVKRSERLLLAALRRHPNVVGIYNAGAAHAAVSAMLRAVDRARAPIFVGHELTAETRAMLRDGTMTFAIDQNPRQQARNAIDFLLGHFGYIASTDRLRPDGLALPFTLHGPYNLETESG